MIKQTPYSILATHYLTSTINRQTTNEEFNKDAEYMIGIKEMFLKSQERFRDNPTERKKKFADMVHSYCKDESKRLKSKHWKNEKPTNN